MLYSTVRPLIEDLSFVIQAMGKFYRDKLEIKLSWKERRPLFSLWLFFTIISNVFLILGSVFEICLEFNVSRTITGLINRFVC